MPVSLLLDLHYGAWHCGKYFPVGVTRNSLGYWSVLHPKRLCSKWIGSSEIMRMVRIGTPIAIGILSYALVYWALLKTSISPLGEPVNAALGIGFSALEGISWPIFAGIMLAASSLISRQLGAEDSDGLDRTLQLSFPAATVLGYSYLVFTGRRNILWFLYGRSHRSRASSFLCTNPCSLKFAAETLSEGI